MPNHNTGALRLHCLHRDELGGSILRNYIDAYHQYKDSNKADPLPIYIPVERDGVVVGNR